MAAAMVIQAPATRCPPGHHHRPRPHPDPSCPL